MGQEENDRTLYSRSERIQMAKSSFRSGTPSHKKKVSEEVYGVDVFMRKAKVFCIRSLLAIFLFGIVYGMKKYNQTPLGIAASDIKTAVESRDEQEALEVWIRSIHK